MYTLLTYSGICYAHYRYQSSIFEEEGFNIESNSNNEIYLQISTEALSRALKSAHVRSIPLLILYSTH